MFTDWTHEDYEELKQHEARAKTELLTQKDLYHDALKVLDAIYWITEREMTDEDARHALIEIDALVWAIGQKVMEKKAERREKKGLPKEPPESFIEFF